MRTMFVVSNIEELFQAFESIKKIIKNRRINGMSKSFTLWYRGQPNNSWQLIPSIQRGNIKTSEQIVCHSFYHRANQLLDTSIPKRCYDKLITLMQHYGVPTRLLDWSYSPLIALFFAVMDEQYINNDACISVLTPEILNYSQGLEPLIYPLDSHEAMNILRGAFYQDSPCKKTIACFPVSNNRRIYAQHAAFTVHGTDVLIDKVGKLEYLYKVIIPKERKQYFCEFLKVFDIQKNGIFPDLSHIAEYISERHLTEL